MLFFTVDRKDRINAWWRDRLMPIGHFEAIQPPRSTMGQVHSPIYRVTNRLPTTNRAAESKQQLQIGLDNTNYGHRRQLSGD